METAYQRFIEHLQEWAIGFPDSPELEALLQNRLTPEEADLLAVLPFLPHSVDQLGLLLNQSPGELARRLDPLAKKGWSSAMNPRAPSATP